MSSAPTAAPAPFDCYRADDPVIDARVRQVTRDGRNIGISGLTFDLLMVLVRAAPALVSADSLIEQVWRGVVVSPETVTQRIKLLRQALGDSAEEPRYVVGQRGRGYRLAVSAVPLPARPQPNPEAVSAPGSVAVMPFANLTGDPANDYLGDGLADELITALGQVPGLNVPARTSSFAYKGHQSDVRRIGEELSVSMVLEGSLSIAEPEYRIGIRLVDAGTGFQIWATAYQWQFSGIFKLQDELAQEIVRVLRGRFGLGLREPSQRLLPTQDSRAYRLYLQARTIARGTDESNRRAMALFDEALSLDPDFADALAYRAILMAGGAFLGREPLDLLDRARADATRALMFRPALAAAHTALGMICSTRANWLEAAAYFKVAFESSRKDPFVRNLFNLSVLRPMGHLRQALSELEESYSLAPADGFTTHELSLTNSLLGRDAEALRYAELTQALSGMAPHWDIMLVHTRAAARAGRYEEAAEYAVEAVREPVRRLGGAQAMRAVYAAFADPLKVADARDALQNLMARLNTIAVDGRTKMFFVAAFVGLDANDHAFALANQLLDLSANALGRIDWSELWTPELAAFRRDARFQQLVSRIGCLNYWRQYGTPDGCELHNGVLLCR
jgi:TolB-like protein/Tfp pilus assembly protein PilF